MLVIPAIILVGIWCFIVFGCIYNGLRGLLGKPIWVPYRGGGGRTARGTPARIIGAVWLLIGLGFLIGGLHAAIKAWNE